MGKKAHIRRSTVKSMLRTNGWYENEFGELKQKITKAEARRRLLRSRSRIQEIFWMSAWDIIDAANQKASDDMLTILDREFVDSVDIAVNLLTD